MASQQHDDDEYDDDAAPEPGADGGGDDGEGARILSLESISEAIRHLEQRVEQALSGGGRTAPQPGGSGSSSPARPTLAQQGDDTRRAIREELAALKAQEKADAERGELLTRLGKVEKSLERAPRQLRKIEERMGWHRP